MISQVWIVFDVDRYFSMDVLDGGQGSYAFVVFPSPEHVTS